MKSDRPVLSEESTVPDAGPLSAAVRLLAAPRPDSVVSLLPVDEAAVTLRLPVVPPRRSWVAPVGAAIGVAALAAGLLLWFAPSLPALHTAPLELSVASPRPAPTVAVGARAPEIIYASAVPVSLPLPDEVEEPEPVLVVEEEEDEVIILDDPPPAKATKRASRRARARTAARALAKKAQVDRSRGDLAAAKRNYAAALSALPSYGPAAAALAELYMEGRKYGTALRYAKRASRAAPRKLDYMLLLGDAYFLAKKRRAARSVWKKASAYGSLKAKARLAR